MDDRPGADARPLFDDLAVKLLDLSGAPRELRIGVANATTGSLEAYRAYLNGVELLNRWDLAGAERDFRRATAIDTTFGLAYYRLALTRGWLVGVGDPIADNAIARATAYSARLPAHDRSVINAYRAFLAGEFGPAREAYQQLLARDPRDADAWYGLGEAWFHDTTGMDQSPAWTHAIRAFKRTLALDPEYALAYEHVQAMLASAASPTPYYALVAADSFAMAEDFDGRPSHDSATRAASVVRARNDALATARNWVTSQPTTLRAHAAMVDAYLISGNYAAAMGEVDRFKQTSPIHPELPFVEARIRFASGDVDRAAAELRSALDTVAPQDFRPMKARRPSSETSPPRRTSSRTRATCCTPRRPSTWPIRCGRKSSPSPRRAERPAAGGDLPSATSTPRPASPRPRSGRCGRAPPKRGAWRLPTNGSTSRTAVRRPRSASSPAPRGTVPR